MKTWNSKRLAVSGAVVAALTIILFWSIGGLLHLADGASEAVQVAVAAAIEGIVTICVPSMFGLAAGYLWAETKRGSKKAEP